MNDKFIKITFFTFSAVLLSYTFYESEIKYLGKERSEYTLYYIICLLLLTLSIMAFKIRKELFLNITVVFVSVFVSLNIINIYLYFSDNQIITSKTGQLEYYLKEKVKNNKLSITLSSKNAVKDNSEPFALADISLRKTIMCNENGYFSYFNSDRYGFNNNDKFWDSNSIDYLLVGDSFTHGACVYEKNSIPGNMRKIFNENDENKTILNLGYSGNGPLREYATLKEYLNIKKTKRIIWVFYENDINDLMQETNNNILINYLNNNNFSQNLLSRQDEIDNKLKEKFNNLYTQKKKEYERRYLSKFYSFLRLNYLKKFIKKRIYPEEKKIKFIKQSTYDDFYKIMFLTKKLASDNNIKLYFVKIPNYSRFFFPNKTKHDLEQYFQQDRQSKKIINIINKLNIPLIYIDKNKLETKNLIKDLVPFRTKNSPMGHFNEDGYSVVANIILKEIKKFESQ